MRQLKITKQITNRETASLDMYLQDIGRVELITAQDEVVLAQKIRAGDQNALDKLVKANLRVAWEVLTPKHHMRPAIIAIPLDAESDLQITILANFITLTPGTLSLDVSPDRKTLYVHAMYVDDVDAFRREIKEKLEQRVIEVFS